VRTNTDYIIRICADNTAPAPSRKILKGSFDFDD
jgi:hypothetical protein